MPELHQLEEELAACLGDDRAWTTDPDVLAAYSRDESAFTRSGRPAALVRPTSTEQVSAVCRLASRLRVPIVPRGAGTGLSGGSCAVDGCIMLSLERMNAIVEIDTVDAVAVVQPGVLNARLRKAVEAESLFYPPDPSSYEIASIGGNVATNAGGLCCVKYGVTRDYVIGLEVVLPDGRVLRTGRRTRKGVAGLDLTGLMVGSEGILGVITEIVVRLERHPGPRRSTILAEFGSLAEAADAVNAVTRTVRPAMLEIMDATAVAAVERHRPMGIDEGVAALLIAESDLLDDASRAAEIAAMSEAMERSGALAVHATDDPQESEMLVGVRRMAGTAMEALGRVLIGDVAVPVSALNPLLTGIQAIAEDEGAWVAIIGHAGDGNMHPTIIFDAHDPKQESRAYRTYRRISRLGLSLGGTVTGEHGIGTLKSELLAEEIGEVGVAVHRAVKQALDPLGIMNPGKVIATR